MRNKSEHISQSVASRIIRELKSRGYGAVPVNTSGREDDWGIEKIWVTKNQKDLCDINCTDNTITYRSNSAQSEISEMLDMILDYQEQEENYNNASPIRAEGLGRYRLICEYNNALLAVCEITNVDPNMREVKDYEYMTWEKDRKGLQHGVHTGRYFGSNYAAAKENFSIRSGMINKDKLFNETEMKAILAGLVKLAALDENTDNNSEVYFKIRQKIESVLPDMEEKLYAENPCYEESRKYAAQDTDDQEESFVLER
jgi:ElaB/YqjD/DUF883 family membrane-anchored ribosome-binding protein